MGLRIYVCLEVGYGATGAFVPDCPGCWVFGRDRGRALEKVRDVVIDWFEWLRGHGERVPDIGSELDVVVGEMLRVDYNPVEAGKPEPLFWSEVPPIDGGLIERSMRLMEYSRGDLMDRISGISGDLLGWRPLGKPRSIENCLRHIAYVEPWYISRLNIELPSDYPEDVFELLDYTRGIVLDVLRDFPEDKMGGVFQPLRDKSPVCDLWTARKVLRRLVDHERLHYRYIDKALKAYGGE
jgi:predicted RNase H-like HicB family nuclease